MAQRATPIPNKSAPARKTAAPGQKQSAGASGGLAQASKRPKSDFIETVWALFCSVRFAVLLNVALALAAMLGTIIPQMPVGIENFPTELDQFLVDASSRYGDLSGVLHWAGFYNLYNSLWFRMLVVTVVFSIVMCTLNRWQPIMRQIKTPILRFSDSFVSGLAENAAFRSVPLRAEAAEGALKGALRKSGYRVVSERSEDGKTLFVYADHHRWSKLVTFVSHAALVLVILTGAGMANAGWREQSVYFYPGVPVSIGHGTDFEVRSDNFSIEYYADGKSVKEYQDTLAVIEGGKDVLTKTIIVNDPLHYKGINYFLVSYQPVAYMRAVDDKGKDLPLRNMGTSGPITATTTTAGALVPFSQLTNDNLHTDFMQLQIPDHFLTLQLTYYDDVTRTDNENPPIFVSGYVDQNFDTPVYNAFLPRTGPLRLPGYEQYSFTFTRATATILEVAKDPGLGLVGFFFFIMALGFTLSLYTSFTRCWARISPNEERAGTVNVLVGGLAEKNKVSFERDFERLATRIRDGLAAAASQGILKQESTQVVAGEEPQPVN
jgi:cytochrome c biogenesis protein